MNGSYIPDPDDCAPACRLFLTVPPSEIIYINSVLDSYEGLGIMRTADEAHGKLVVYTTLEYEACLLELIAALNAEGVNIVVDNVDYEDVIG